MSTEIELLLLDGLIDGNTVYDILLGSVFNTDETETQVHILSLNHSLSIGSLVHDIDFRDNTDCPDTFGVDLSRHLKTIGGGHICIGWQGTQNNSSGVTDISHGHCSCNLFNIVWLVRSRHWNSRNTWQINQGQIWACMRVDRQNDWLIDNIFTLTADLVGEEINRLLDLSKIRELLVGHLIELGPWGDVFGGVIQTQFQGSSRDDTITSGEEVQTDNRLEDG